jgi:catechol 2,3-dioxygenase-like lactoylglutathione lyase family enzyme
MSVIRNMTDDAITDPKNQGSVLHPYMISHGTLECRSLAKSRTFYEEFLGLECVVHSPTSMAIRCGLKFHITAVEVGDALHPGNLLNHWGLDLESRDAVDKAYADIIAEKERYGIAEVKQPTDRHGVYSFYLQDLDGNWWEIQHYDGFLHDDIFDFGDQYALEDRA